MTDFSVVRVTDRDVFRPYRDRGGFFVLYSKERARLSGKPLHHAVNKVSVRDFPDAVALFQAGDHSWRLRGDHTRQENTFTRGVVIESVGS